MTDLAHDAAPAREHRPSHEPSPQIVRRALVAPTGALQAATPEPVPSSAVAGIRTASSGRIARRFGPSHNEGPLSLPADNAHEVTSASRVVRRALAAPTAALAGTTQTAAASANVAGVRRVAPGRIVRREDNVVRRKGKTDQQRIDETKVHSDRLTALRDQVIFALEDRELPKALTGFEKLQITYSESGKWGGSSLAKLMRGTSTLDPLRVRAKSLVPTKDTKPVKTVTDEVSAVAKATREVARPSNLTVDNLDDHGHILDMVEKIVYYLVNAVPTSMRQFAKQIASVPIDVSAPLGGGGAANGVPAPKSDKVQGDETDVGDALESGEIESRGFHGSASWLLEGLDKSAGKLLSQKAAFDQGLLKTGEGTTFSSGASLKTNVYIGKGEMGFGTAASYALAPAVLKSYNVSLFSDVELNGEIDKHRQIIQLESLLAKVDQKTATSGKAITMERVKEAATNAGLDPADPGYTHMFKWQNLVQLKEMLGKLLKEQESRAEWDVDDPRRAGGQVSPDNYPILLEFDLTTVAVVEDPAAKSRVQKGDYRLAGEATVKDEVDLGNGRLKVVYCPELYIAKTTAKLKTVFGDANAIEVRALESIKGALPQDGPADKTLKATYGQLEKQQKSLDVKMKAHTDVAANLAMPDKVYGGSDGNKELTKIDVRGRKGYVDEGDQPGMENEIIDMMSEDAPKVPLTKKAEAVLTMGGPGAGKSSILDIVVPRRNHYVVVNPDDVKEALPEYQRGLKSGNANIANQMHQQSKTVATKLATKAMLQRQNVIYDATGANKGDYATMIAGLKKQNYTIKLVMVHVTADEGVRRVKDRAQVTGRNVPENIVRGVYPHIGPNFVALAPTVEHAVLYENMAKKPKLLWDSLVNADVALAKTALGLK